jgi:glycerophosphoryl diester phosphodiesterase
MTPSSSAPSTLRSTFAKAAWLVRGKLVSLALFSLVCKAIHFAILAPVAASILQLFLQRWGRASVGNFEIASFLLSPSGVIGMCIVGGITLAMLYVEIAGLMQIMLKYSCAGWSHRVSYGQLFLRLLRVGAIQLSIGFVVALPFALLVYVIYQWLWSDRDLNGLIVLKPAEFWWGVGLASLVVTTLAILLAAIFIRGLFAPVIILCEQEASPWRALSTSARLTKPRSSLITKGLAIWFVAQLAGSFGVLALLHFLLLRFLDHEWPSLTTAALVTGICLSIETVVGILLSVVSNIGFAATVLGLHPWDGIDEDSSLLKTVKGESGASQQPQSAVRLIPVRWWILAGSASLAVSATAVSFWISDTFKLTDRISITAHRAGAAYAPENTLAALRRAMEDQAGWAEIDVQLTADEELVVMHDTDLARIGGGTAQVGKSTLAQIQSLDVGSLFSEEFRGERVPLFREVLETARGRIRLNVELKPHGSSDTSLLVHRVVSAIQESKMVDQCRICSQSYEGIQLAKVLEPKIEIGFIVSTSLGDSTRLDVDYLMVSHGKITRSLVERAQARGVQIHAWTVNDPRLVLKLVDAGVSNIITDDVIRIGKQIEAIQSLRPMERLLLRAKNGMSASVVVPEHK